MAAVVIIAGLEAGPTGTGQFLAELLQERERDRELRPQTRFLFSPHERRQRLPPARSGRSVRHQLLGGQLWAAGCEILRRAWRHPTNAVRSTLLEQRFRRQLQSRVVLEADAVILIHPQTIGFEHCLRLIKHRTTATHLYLIDAAFFCVRSYNHLPLESQSCLRCLGGTFSAADVRGCRPWPTPDFAARRFVEELRPLVQARRVRLLAQHRGQAELARRHSGSQALIQVLGLWCADYQETIAETPAASEAVPAYDVVYHGPALPAKGCGWCAALARVLPAFRFLFPFSSQELHQLGIEAPPNVTCQPLRWNTGLAAAVHHAKLVLVPSLWSAPIEGALIKSLLHARAVAVVQEPTTFAAELPDGLVLRVPPEIEQAAVLIAEALHSSWQPTREVKTGWWQEFQETQQNPLRRLLRVLSEQTDPASRSVATVAT